jgi:hypothetical protein
MGSLAYDVTDVVVHNDNLHMQLGCPGLAVPVTINQTTNYRYTDHVTSFLIVRYFYDKSFYPQ